MQLRNLLELVRHGDFSPDDVAQAELDLLLHHVNHTASMIGPGKMLAQAQTALKVVQLEEVSLEK